MNHNHNILSSDKYRSYLNDEEIFAEVECGLIFSVYDNIVFYEALVGDSSSINEMFSKYKGGKVKYSIKSKENQVLFTCDAVLKEFNVTVPLHDSVRVKATFQIIT